MDQHRELTGDEPTDGGDGPSEALLREEQVELVRSAMDSLNEEHRTILVLREME